MWFLWPSRLVVAGGVKGSFCLHGVPGWMPANGQGLACRDLWRAHRIRA